MKNDLVTVVIPCFNTEKFLKRCIDSILNQTYKHIEIIAIDDCSTDNTFEVLTNVLTNVGVDTKIIRNETNSGVHFSRNIGISLAKGKWIYFIDSDDYIDPLTFEKMLDFNNEPDAIFAGFDVVKTDIANTLFKKIYSIESQKLQLMFLVRKIKLLCPGTLYKTNFLKENNLFFEHLRWSEDQHFIWRVIEKASHISFLDANCYHYYVNHSSIMWTTRPSKIIDAYPYFLELGKHNWSNDKIKRFLAPRWVLGSLNAYSRMCLNFNEWLELYKALDGKKSCNILLRFPNLSTRIISFICFLSPRIFFNICRRKGR